MVPVPSNEETDYSKDSGAVKVLRILQRHTALTDDRLKQEADAVLAEADNFADVLAYLKARGFIESSTVGWQLSNKGNEWLGQKGESLTTEEEDVGVDDQIKRPYDVAKLKVEQKLLSVFQALRKIEKNEIYLTPEFQRAFVWDEVRQSRLIESILIRIPLPAFYLDATDLVKWNVVDGLQRLTTLYRYCRTPGFRLRGLEFLTELDGLTFDELPPKYRVLIEDDTQLIFNNLLPGTPIEAKFTIFSRVNTGGMQLTAQEIRHALNQGRVTRLLQRLASGNQFLDYTDRAVDSRRMADQELILRTLSFMHFGWRKYQDFMELDKFLIDSMGYFNNNIAEEKLAMLGEKFIECVGKVRKVFGPYAFRKFYVFNGRRGPLNKALFEAWTVCVQGYDLELLLEAKVDLINGFLKLMSDPTFNNAITYGTGKFSSIKTRFERLENLLSEVCGDRTA